MPIHIVKQGEFLAKIASDFGFTTWREIWGHADNSALRAKRKNPNVLMPGDKLFVPERAAKDVSASTDTRHRFRTSGSPLVLRVVFRDLNDKPIADTPCELHLGSDVLHVRTDGDGRIERAITPGTTNATVVFERNVSFDIAIPLEIGALDPVEEPSGQRSRLNNLGYFAGDAAPAPGAPDTPPGAPPAPPPGTPPGASPDTPPAPAAPDAEAARAAQLKSAIEEFQCDQGLKVDGVCGSKTQERLKQVYGC